MELIPISVFCKLRDFAPQLVEIHVNYFFASAKFGARFSKFAVIAST